MAEQENSPKVRIAIVGMTGAGKTVLISALAMKMSQMADQGIFLTPMGETRRQTLRYVQTNWETLNNGQWPPSTPAGELIHLEWELNTKKNVALVRFTDCAGQDIRTIFSQDNFNVRHLSTDLYDTFGYLNNANILIFLVNMEDLLGKSMRESIENALDIDQMIYVLNQKSNVPRKVAVVFSQYDKYKPEVDIKYDGDLLEYIRANLPQLHGEYVQKKSFEFIPVAAVNKTRLELVDGEAKQVPQPGFDSYNLDSLIWWIGDQVDELSAVLGQPSMGPPPPPVRPGVDAPKQAPNREEKMNPWGPPPLVKEKLSFLRNVLFPVCNGCGCGCLTFFLAIIVGAGVFDSIFELSPDSTVVSAFFLSMIVGSFGVFKGFEIAFNRIRANEIIAQNNVSWRNEADICSNKQVERYAILCNRFSASCSTGSIYGFVIFIVFCILLGAFKSSDETVISVSLFFAFWAFLLGVGIGWFNPKNKY